MIPPGADIYDPALTRMIAAFDERGGWNEVHDSLRDALVSYARTRCPYYRRRIPPGARFEEMPLLRRQDVREHLGDLLAKAVPPERRVEKRTSGSTGEPLLFYRDTTRGERSARGGCTATPARSIGSPMRSRPEASRFPGRRRPSLRPRTT
jgi:hypothetical protein